MFGVDPSLTRMSKFNIYDIQKARREAAHETPPPLNLCLCVYSISISICEQKTVVRYAWIKERSAAARRFRSDGGG